MCAVVSVRDDDVANLVVGGHYDEARHHGAEGVTSGPGGL